jgi:hypothetical protein
MIKNDSGRRRIRETVVAGRSKTGSLRKNLHKKAGSEDAGVGPAPSWPRHRAVEEKIGLTAFLACFFNKAILLMNLKGIS